VHKVSIIARGMMGGYTLALPEEDRTLQRKAKFEDDLAFALGGRAAEEIVFGDITTGASNDLERVTQTARAMVTRYGMSEKLGPMVYGQKEELVFLGREIGEQRDYSDAVAEEIDQEVRRIVSEAHEKARRILTEYQGKLDAIAQRLIEVETLDAAEFAAFFEDDSGIEAAMPPGVPPITVGRAVGDSETERPSPGLDMSPRPSPA